MSKTPNLVQSQTGVYKYPTLVLAAMNVLTKNTRDPGLPSRIQQPAPQPQLQTPKAPAMQPAPGLTNRPGYPVK
jgi:hypothetical protein